LLSFPQFSETVLGAPPLPAILLLHRADVERLEHHYDPRLIFGGRRVRLKGPPGRPPLERRCALESGACWLATCLI